MKRILSLIIAVSMLLTMIPPSLASDGELYTYNFNCDAVGKSSGTRIQDNYGAASAGSAVSAPWTFYGTSYLNNGQFRTDSIYWNSLVGNAGSEVFNIVIHIEVPKDGQYVPSMKYKAMPSSYKAKLLITTSDEADEAKLFGKHDNWDIRGYVPNHASDIIGEIDMYSESEEIQEVSFEAVELTAGNYNLIISSNGKNENCQPLSQKYIEGSIISFSLDGTEPESIRLSSDIGTDLNVGDTASISTSVKYKSGKTLNISSGITFKSLDETILAVNPKGTVTALSEGTARVRASIDGTSVSDEILFTVEGEDVGNSGVTLVYNMSSTSILTPCPGISGGVLRDFSYIKTFDKIDAQKSAPWCFSKHTVYSANLDTLYFNGSVKAASYPDHPIFGLKIRVPNKGDYDLLLRAYHRSYGSAAEIYIVPAENNTEASYVLTQSADAQKIGSYDFSDMKKENGSDVKLGRVNIKSSGDYYVIFVFNSTNTTFLSGSYHGFYIAGMSLKACAGEFENIGISIDEIEEEGDPMPIATVKQAKTVLKDAGGTVIEDEDIDKSKLSVKWSIDDENVASIASDGTVEAKKSGSAKIQAIVEYDGKVRIADYNLLVAPAGKNLMEDRNPKFDSDEWVWDISRCDSVEEGRFMNVGIGICEKDGDASNRAMAVRFNPDVAAQGNPPPVFLDPSRNMRIKIDSDKLYQLSFKMKLDYENAPSASDMMLIYDLYGYIGQVGASSSDITGDSIRSMDVSKCANYREVYDDWHEVVIPICGPLSASAKSFYVSPRLVFRPNAADLSKAGYNGTIWIDDFELREVGFAGVNLEAEGITNVLGEKPLTISVKPYTSTGQYISLGSTCLPDCLTFTSSDEYVVNPASNSKRASLVADSGIYIAQAMAVLGGKNGTTTMTATMDLNGIKKSGSCEITTSDLPITLLYAESFADRDAISVGEDTQITAVGYYSSGDEVPHSECEITYSSEDESILKVDEKTGVVTGIRAGSANVISSVKLGNASVDTSSRISVYDHSKIISASLSAPESVGYLRDENLTITGMMESGYAADISSADIEYIVTSEPVGGISIVNGKVFGNTLGAEGKIKVRVTLNGATVESNEAAVTVTESDMRSFSIDFRRTSVSKPLLARIDSDGWEIDTDASNSSVSNAYFDAYGLAGTLTAPNRNLVLKVDVPYTGNYKIIYSSWKMSDGAELLHIYVDDVYVGKYNAYASGNYDGGAEDMRTIYLTAGTHTFTISPQDVRNNSRGYYVYPKVISFSAREALPTVSEIRTSAESYELRVGDSAVLTSEMRLSDGFWYDVRNMYDTSKSNVSTKPDPNASITYTSGNTSVVTIGSDGKIKATGAGDTVITVTAKSDGSMLEKEIPVSVDGSGIETATIKGDRRTFYVGENFVLEPRVILASGAELSEENITGVTWSTDDAAIASVSGSTLVAVAEGETILRGTVIYNGITRDIEETITVEADCFGALEVEADTLVMRPNSEGVTLSVKAKTHLGKDVSMSGAEISFESDNEDVAAVSDDGHVTPAAVGMADITVSVTIDGVTVSKTVTVSVRTGKVSGTIYTEEMVAAARENSKKYTWAKSAKDSYEKACEQYLSKSMDELWKMIPGEGIPRSVAVGYRNDPEMYTCRYCRANLFSLYGNYPWVCKPATRPWKVQCPECKRVFPSNDFGKFYELGLDEHGIFSRQRALKKHQELFGGTYGVGYLKNELYPEVGETLGIPEDEIDKWGVDDGFGYDTGKTGSNGVRQVHTYIAYYNHFGLWYTTGGYITKGIKDLAFAYMYTGDKKYGRLGAIMLDRVADLYPGFDLSAYLPTYANSDGGGGRGKIIGSIWETYLAEDFSRCYDALFPMFDDDLVVDFLSEKANQYNLTEKLVNGKATPETLRENCETGILREVYKGVCSSQTAGNFGMHHGALAAAAVALDSQEETDEMIDWIFKNGVKTQFSNTGGGVSARLIDSVSRDGQGNESAPGYNRLWVDSLTNLANLLGPYEGYDGMDLYGNPKYIAMVMSYAPLTLVRRGVAPIGDSGVAGMYSLLPDNIDVLIDSYRFLKDSRPEIAREIAQHLYFVKGGDLSDLHYSAFVKNPEDVRNEIEDVVERYGEYDYDKSTLLSGYGFVALRGGTLRESVGINSFGDTQRDFWMYFGGSVSHNHQDKLNLGMEAYGIGMTTDLGYPEATGSNPNRYQWQNATISHNTVVVNEREQNIDIEPHNPTHFDAKDGRVKVMSVDARHAYTETEEYDRTVVMVDYDSDVSYGIDFFKVRGGNDHLYSFHPSSEVVSSFSDNLKFKTQAGGTYAGASVPFGNDPYTNESSQYTVLKYPNGYTWLENIRKDAQKKKGEFWVDYKIKDYAKLSRNSDMDIHLRITMLNDFDVNEVTLATGMPPRNKNNLSRFKYIQYMLVRRKGENLNTLFTTVYEPYSGSRYVKSMESVPVTLVSGSPKNTDAVKAVKVELVNGRTDYIVYAQDNTATYDVGGVFEFCGFVGVYSINENGDNIYSYVNDGEKIGENDGLDASIGGSVKGFTKDLVFDNSIDVEFDTDGVNPEDLIDRTIHIENDGVRNAVYTVKNAVMTGERTARIDVGNITFIRAYKDKDNADLGYVYDIAENQRFEIPMSYEFSGAPVFDEIKEVTATADSSITLHVKASSDDDVKITYKARRLPTGASFNEETGEFNWKPTSSQIGENIVGIDAIDSEGRVSTVYFTITVYGSTTPSGGGSSGGGGGGGTPTPTPDPEPTPTPEPEPTPNPEPTPDPTPGDNDGGFVDIDNYAWAKDSINALAKDGIIKGTSEDTFSPSSNITRADFAILLVRAFKLTGEGEENFNDVAAGDYFAHELAIAKENGIVGGIGDNKYAPRNTITREDMMVIVYRALLKLGYELKSGEITAPDFESVSDYAKEAVSALVANGLVNGKNGYIDPKAYITRAEVAVLVKRILDFTEE